MPNSVEKTISSLSLTKKNIFLDEINNQNLLKPGNIIKKGEILFKKIESD